MKRLSQAVGFGLLSMCAAAGANQADIYDSLEAARSHYQAGALLPAAQQLDLAAALIRQQRGEQLIHNFPPPPSGWKAHEASITQGDVLGNMLSVERQYYKGNDTITADITVETSMAMQSLLLMQSSPALATMSGGRVRKVQGIQAILTTNAGYAELRFHTEKGTLISLEGPLEYQQTLFTIGEAIDLTGL